MKWSSEVNQKKDKKMMKYILQDIGSVDKELRKMFLKKYLSACKMKHSIAFFQWRNMYAPGCNQDELLEVFESKLDFMRQNSQRLLQKYSLTKLPKVNSVAGLGQDAV